MGMAGPSLVASARRLCGTFQGKDVLADDRRPFQVDGYPLCELCHLQRDQRQDEVNFRFTWLTRDCSVR